VAHHAIPEIDGLRAAAVGAVIASHLLGRYFPNGGVGVDLFFVISGVVITRSLVQDHQRLGKISLPRFYLKRVYRIIPALWMLVGSTICIGLLTGRPQMWDAAATLASVMNWARAFGWLGSGDSLAHAWSLSVEEQFYLLWPLGLVLLLDARRASMLWVVAGVAVSIALWRTALTLSGVSVPRLYNGLDTHADGLMLGCFLTLWGRRPPHWVSAAWWVPAAILSFLILYTGLSASFGRALRWDLVPLMCTWIVLAALGPPTLLHPLLRLPVLQWGGTRSYSLYLWHFPIHYYLDPWRFPFPAKLPLMIVLTLAAAEASYRWVEQPFQRRAKARLARNPPGEAEPRFAPDPAGLASREGHGLLPFPARRTSVADALVPFALVPPAGKP